MQRLEVSGAVRPIYGSLGVKRLKLEDNVVVRSCLRGGVHAGRSQYSRRFAWRKIDVVQGKGAEYGKII